MPRGIYVKLSITFEEIEARLQAGESLRSIARSEKVPYQTLQYWRKKWGGKPLPSNYNKSGADHHLWKGGVLFDTNGYKRIHTTGRGTVMPYAYEHTVVAEKHIGRQLKRHEHVHHINAIPLDNRPENLLVCTASEHRLLHRRLENLALELVRSGKIVFRDNSYFWADDFQPDK